MKTIFATTLLAAGSATAAAFEPSRITRINTAASTTITNRMSIIAATTAPQQKQQPAATSKRSTSTSTSIQMVSSFLDNIPNPFADTDKAATQPRPPSVPPPVSNEADALFSRAKAIIAADLGLRDPSILADDFKWVGPNVVSTGALEKDEYLAAGLFFNLRRTFPDLDYRAHDFRLDLMDPLTVRLTARTVGTMRGELRLRSESIAPNGKRMICPPEAISMTFDAKSGKLVKLCSGFCMDRLVGNTGGLCGVMAAATVAGSPPSEWELYPPSVVVGRFFSRSVKQLKEPDQFFLAPFPESVMIQLAKGVLAAETGTKDPDLLASKFTYCGPFIEPLNKNEFLKEFTRDDIRQAFPDLNENYSNFRVDPYDPYRVWYDVKSMGTRTGELEGKEPDGAKYVGPPEAASMTFDDDGFCTRMTGGAVMDPSACNTGGLGGVSGLLYASGAAPPAVAVRPLPQILSRFQKALLSPITGDDIDDFSTTGVKETKFRPSPPPVPPQQVEETIKQEVVKAPIAPTPIQKIEPPKPKVSVPKISVPKVSVPKVSVPKLSIPKVSVPKVSAPKVSTAKVSTAKKSTAISDDPSDAVTDVFSNLFGGSKIEEKKDTKVNQSVENKKKLAEEKRKKTLAATEAKRQETEEKKAKALAALAEKKKSTEEKQKSSKQVKEAENVLNKATSFSTISLGFLNFGQKSDGDQSGSESEQASSAPRGVPSLKNWRQNKDGSITGLIYGSRAFSSGESITTSPIKGKPAENAVSVTKTGSKYYLETNSAVGKNFFSFGVGEKKEPSQALPSNKQAQIQAAKKAEKGKRVESAERKKEEQLKAQQAKAEAVERKKEEQLKAQQAKAEAVARKKEEQSQAQQTKAEAVARKKEEAEAKAEVAARKKEEQLKAQQSKAEAAARKKEEQLQAQQSKAEAAARKKEEQSQARQAKTKAATLKQQSGTISLGSSSDSSSPGLFSFGKGASKPPAGVPVITRWKRNSDGTVTGLISGAKSFKEGEKVTTSKLAAGQTPASGKLVVTNSGSKYFLK